MVVPGMVIEGTWEELATHADELRDKRLRLTVVSEKSVSIGNSGSDAETPQTLAEFLGDFVGSIEGSGAAKLRGGWGEICRFFGSKASPLSVMILMISSW